MPASLIKHIVLFGPVPLSAGLRSHLLWRGIFVSLLSIKGKWLGSVSSAKSFDGHLLRQQVNASGNPKSLTLSKALVAGKISNQRALLLRYSNGCKSTKIFDVCVELLSLHDSVYGCTSLGSLLGFEGRAAKVYFS